MSWIVITLLQVFVATTLDSPDSWTESCLKQKLFDGANSRNLPDQDKNTRGGGGTCDEVKSTMQVSMVDFEPAILTIYNKCISDI